MRFLCEHCHSVLEIGAPVRNQKFRCDGCGKYVTPPFLPVAKGVVLGNFALEKFLGAGGSGRVYLAERLFLGQKVAVKVLNPSFAQEAGKLQVFMKEAQLSLQFDHPALLRAYDVGKEGNIAFYAMEYAKRGSLQQYLKEQGILPETTVLQIISSVANGLFYVWEKHGILHRDIKPENILLTEELQPKLADMGLACQGERVSFSHNDEIMGTPQYLAPEVLLGKGNTQQSDIYSLGATMYYLLTGEYPYPGRNAEEMARGHLEQRLVPVREKRPEISLPVAMLVESMLTKRPVHRIRDYEELLSEFQLVQSGQYPRHLMSPYAQTPIDWNREDPLAEGYMREDQKESGIQYAFLEYAKMELQLPSEPRTAFSRRFRWGWAVCFFLLVLMLGALWYLFRMLAPS